MYINANSDRFSGTTLNLVQEGGIGIFGFAVLVFIAVCRFSVFYLMWFSVFPILPIWVTVSL